MTSAPAAASGRGPQRFGAPPQPPAGATNQGPVASDRQLRLTVVLRSANPSGLAAFAAGTTDPASAHYHRFVSPSGFAARFGASPSAVSAVRGWLESTGLTPGSTTPNGLAIPVVASAGKVEHALGVSVDRFRLRSGREAYANTASPLVPVAVAADIQAILGLEDLARLRPGPTGPPRPSGRHQGTDKASGAGSAGSQSHALVGSSVATSGPAPCPAATSETTAGAAWTANQLAQAYEMSNLYGIGLLGGSVTVGLFELEPYLSSDIKAYQDCYGTNASVTNVAVDGGAGTGAGSGEAALDIEDVVGLAPQTNILVYEAPNTLGSAYDNFNAMIGADQAQVISTSWGLCEQNVVADAGVSYLQAENTLFEEAAAQGQSVLAAAGDSGSNDCGNHTLAVEDPASQPYVTGVGGTSLTALGPAPTETVWNDTCSTGACAGGGGISTVWPMPSWQSGPGVVSSYSSGSPCGNSSGYCREVPDVTASADPAHGYVVYYNGSWQVFGGTSAATPLWAALVALVDNGCAATPVGFLNPRLYQAAASGPSPFNDITVGNNAIFGSDKGKYPATSAYDMASGLGSAIAPTLLDALCAPQVTQISPADGPSAGATTVTITGTGFTPTTRVDFGSVPAASVTVDSATTLTAVSPPGAGTVAVNVATAGGQSSTVATAADQYDYGLPAVTGLSAPSAKPGASTTISGVGFGSVQATSYVSFDDSGISWGGPSDAARLTIDSWGTSSITFTVPGLTQPWAVTLGTVASVSVTVGGVTSDSVPLSIVPAASIPMSITSPSPADAASGGQVTLGTTGETGDNFGVSPGWVTLTDSGISWGGPSDAARLTIDSWSSDSITFTVPGLTQPWAVTPGTTAAVTVTTASGGLSNPVPLAIAPTSSSLALSISSPSSGGATPGESMTLSGSNLGTPGWISFVDSGIGWGAPGDATPLDATSWTTNGSGTTTISFTVPTVSGPWAVTPGATASLSVTNSAGQFSNTVTIQIVPTAQIAIASGSPSPASAAAGQTVTLDAAAGSSFGSPGWVSLDDAGISWGGPSDAARLTIDSWTSSAITFTVPTPQGSAYQWQVIPDTTATVTVTTSAWAQSTPVSLAVVPSASIPLVSMSPSSPTPGDSVTLTGAGFGSNEGSGYVTLVDNGISWGAPNDAAQLDITQWQTDASGTSTIVFDMPPSTGTWPVAPGTVATVVVTNAADAVSNAVSFTVG